MSNATSVCHPATREPLAREIRELRDQQHELRREVWQLQGELSRHQFDRQIRDTMTIFWGVMGAGVVLAVAMFLIATTR